MKNFLPLLLLTLSSCNPVAGRMSEASAFGQQLETVLSVQIAADKEHHVYVSDNESQKTLTLMQLYEFGLTEYNIGDVTYLNASLFYESDPQKAVAWSKALAKYRFATAENERLELINSLIQDSVNKGVFARTSSFLNCATGRVILNIQNAEQELFISFRPALSTSSLQPNSLVTNEYSKDDGNDAIDRMYLAVKNLAQVQGKNHVRGILYAWTKQYGGQGYIQSCDVTVPL